MTEETKGQEIPEATKPAKSSSHREKSHRKSKTHPKSKKVQGKSKSPKVKSAQHQDENEKTKSGSSKKETKPPKATKHGRNSTHQEKSQKKSETSKKVSKSNSKEKSPPKSKKHHKGGRGKKPKSKSISDDKSLSKLSKREVGTYYFHVEKYGPCSESCRQHRRVSCIKRESASVVKEVKESECALAGLTVPSSEKWCSDVNCHYWKAGDYGRVCSKTVY